ncbi:exodeoxyribonuclease X [Erwinia sp. OLTSP20]|uniref:exodeoxyribonuclease X n=1 Tax=unclassified Erwinia TaxID=2622719 RepID=UPI000C1A0917|nr:MULTISPECIES: exodeoxyribonuclease X [unclassified Erwinia]PIJ51446.1 exodeoxyribonuclease X [Erwinia sp. OAMSP11]PIJ73468.1 exodeoxyribonuclease X [Erwinia sp. OLSSP12]PIJ85531.1 exodeoxyribonuclease X [Erwinia sp. OLCASP19]PIJ85929.1 exodeoxyribonuclease X [Erwinia sp. OLMTSP26]PIJ87410.1 exodeoxyribonuclease X [Erwinia sp. OLMDSP33]
MSEPTRFRVIDTETCGLDGGVVEIASVDVVAGEIVNPMSDLVQPDRPIGRQAMAIHRITPAMVRGMPPVEEVIPRYQGCQWYVAHNASFDQRVLPAMTGNWLCTMKLARQLWPGRKYGNQALKDSLQLDVTPPDHLHAHRALYDCYVTAALLLRIMQESGWDAPTMAARIAPRSEQQGVLPFGKYRGQSITEVAQKNPAYLRWMLENIRDLKPALRQAVIDALQPVS